MVLFNDNLSHTLVMQGTRDDSIEARIPSGIGGSVTGKCKTFIFLISNFRRVLYVVCFLLGNSPASESYVPTFRIFIGR